MSSLLAFKAIRIVQILVISRPIRRFEYDSTCSGAKIGDLFDESGGDIDKLRRRFARNFELANL